MSKWRLLPLLILLTTGCSTLPTGSSPQLSRQIEELQSRVLALQQQTTVDELEIGRLRTRLDAVEAELQGRSAQGSRPTREPAGGIGGEDRGVVARSSAIEVSDLEETLPAAVDSSPDLQVTAELSAASQAVYDRGYTLYHQGRYFDAEERFARFLESDGESELADNAQYWIGESRVARGDLQPALAAFRETVRRYPDGNKAPDALFKVGRVLESLGDLDGARKSYLDVQNRYPGSDVSSQAAKRLEGP